MRYQQSDTQSITIFFVVERLNISDKLAANSMNVKTTAIALITADTAIS